MIGQELNGHLNLLWLIMSWFNRLSMDAGSVKGISEKWRGKGEIEVGQALI